MAPCNPPAGRSNLKKHEENGRPAVKMRAQLLKTSLTDLKKDLETVQQLCTENVINVFERDALKNRLLQLDAGNK